MSPDPLSKVRLARLADRYELRKSGLDRAGQFPLPARILGALIAFAASVRRSWRAIAEARQARLARLRVQAFERLHPMDPQDWAISCPFSIGDVYLYASLAKALLANRGGRRVRFFTKPEHAFIPRLFPSVSESIAIMPPFVPREIGRKPGKSWLDPDVDRGRFLKPGWAGLDMIGYRDIGFLDCLRADLRLPADALPERPLPPSGDELAAAREWLKSLGFAPGRLAILSPDATATQGIATIPDAFWAALIAGLRERGIGCVTNIGGPASRVLDGAPGLPIPLDRLRAIACATGAVVANRSGICDLLCDLPLKLAVLFPAADFYGGRLFPATSLRAMNWENAGLVEQQIDCDHWQPGVDPIIAAIAS